MKKYAIITSIFILSLISPAISHDKSNYLYNIDGKIRILTSGIRDKYNDYLKLTSRDLKFDISMSSQNITDYDLVVFFYTDWSKKLGFQGMDSFEQDVHKLADNIGNMTKKAVFKADDREILFVFFNTQDDTISDECLAQETLRIIGRRGDFISLCARGNF